MKVFITGGTGLLGSNLITELKKRGIDYFAPTSNECNIIDSKSVSKSIHDYNPDVVIHCAAIAKYKIVETMPMKTILTNVVGTCNVITACESVNTKVKLVYISSDHVFDGKKGNYTTLRFHKNDINKVTCVYGNLTPKLKWCGVELEEITY